MPVTIQPSLKKQLQQQDAAVAAGLSCVLVGIIAALAAMTHSRLPQALLFPGMLLLGTLVDSTSTYLFYALSALVDIVLYAAILYIILRLRRSFQARQDRLSTPDQNL